VQSVTARLRRLFIEADVPDSVMALLEFESGALGVLATGWASPATYQMRLFGTEVNLFFDADLGLWQRSEVLDSRSRLEIQRRGEADRSRLDLPPTDMFREQIEEFAHAIRGEAVVEVSIEDSLRALAVVLAAVESSERGGSPVSPAELIRAAEAALT
jgi:predicted dehydrogenase